MLKISRYTCWIILGALVAGFFGVLNLYHQGTVDLTFNRIVAFGKEVDEAYVHETEPTKKWALLQFVRCAEDARPELGNRFSKLMPELFVAHSRLAKLAASKGASDEAKSHSERALQYLIPEMKTRVGKWEDVVPFIEKFDKKAPQK